jgi:hypothetical protein
VGCICFRSDVKDNPVELRVESKDMGWISLWEAVERLVNPKLVAKDGM